jgi:alcohol dehydrogenase class IV
VEELCRSCGVPTLRGYGIDPEAFTAAIDKMAHDAIASGSPANTWRAVTEEDCKVIYRRLIAL